jgi:hypothetical protein
MAWLHPHTYAPMHTCLGRPASATNKPCAAHPRGHASGRMFQLLMVVPGWAQSGKCLSAKSHTKYCSSTFEGSFVFRPKCEVISQCGKGAKGLTHKNTFSADLKKNLVPFLCRRDVGQPMPEPEKVKLESEKRRTRFSPSTFSQCIPSTPPQMPR